MTEEFIRRNLTTSVAQICSNIGWHTMSSSTMQMMTDILYEYFKDLAQSVKKFSEISDTLEPDIDDVKMAFQDKNVSIPDLIRYLKQVACIEFPHQVPKFPIPTKSSLNIMKPGSREIVTRPVYFHEHLPSMYPEHSDEKTVQNDRNLSQTANSSSSFGMFNDPLISQESQAKNNGSSKDNTIVHRRLREISSVVMTTSGFLSPSREGKLPESRLLPFHNFKASTSQSSFPKVPSEVKNDITHHQQHQQNPQQQKQSQQKQPQQKQPQHKQTQQKQLQQKQPQLKQPQIKQPQLNQPQPQLQSQQQQPQQHLKKSSQKTPNTFKEKGKNIIENTSSNINNISKNNAFKIKKLPSVKETSKLKAFKTAAIRESNQGPRLKKIPKIKDKSKLSLLNTIFDKPVQASSSHSKYSKNPLSDSEKLTTEPDKQKLNIFKKITKTKETTTNASNNESSAHQSTGIASRPITSTIVSSDILAKPEIKLEVIEEDLFNPELFKTPIEKKHDDVHKSSIKEIKPELNSNTHKKRKKKQKIPSSDINHSSLDTTSNNIGTKKLKTKHDPDLFSSPLKFSFFGHLPSVPGLLPTGPTILPPSLASNPLVPKYTTPNVLPIIEKASTLPSMMYLPLPGEDDFDKSKFDELSSSLNSEKEKGPTEKIKSKKEHKIKSKKKKDKKNKTKIKERSERKKEKLLKKLKNKKKVVTEEFKPESVIVKEKEIEPKIDEEDSLVPKIKLKIAGSNGSGSSTSLQRKIVIKPVIKDKSPPPLVEETHIFSKEKSPVEHVKPSVTKLKAHSKDKVSASILPLVGAPNKEETKPPEIKPSKIKKSSLDNINISSTSVSSLPAMASSGSNSVPLKNKIKVKIVKKPKKTETQKHPAFYYDENGSQVWICPTCGKQDDGSPMIGCDGCDAWYHWVCVGIQCPPDCQIWYCPTCLVKRAERSVTPIEKAKRGRPLKKKSISCPRDAVPIYYDVMVGYIEGIPVLLQYYPCLVNILLSKIVSFFIIIIFTNLYNEIMIYLCQCARVVPF